MKTNKTQYVPAVVLEENSYYPWVVLVSSFMMRFLVFGQLFSVGLLYVSWIDEFQRSRAETAWVASIATGTTLLMGLYFIIALITKIKISLNFKLSK